MFRLRSSLCLTLVASIGLSSFTFGQNLNVYRVSADGELSNRFIRAD